MSLEYDGVTLVAGVVTIGLGMCVVCDTLVDTSAFFATAVVAYITLIGRIYVHAADHIVADAGRRRQPRKKKSKKRRGAAPITIR